MKQTEASLTESMTYVLQNYGEKKEDIMYNSPITYTSNATEPTGLSFFESVGYPLPSDDEIEEYEDYKLELYYHLFTESAFQENKISYADFFYYVTALPSTDLYRLKLKEVIKLTEDDKYSEIRIEAEEALKSNQP